MIKDRQPDWQDTNVNLVGSDIDRKCKEAAANGEPQSTSTARRWAAGVADRAVPRPCRARAKSKYGRFHIGDSYIVLNTYVKDPANPNKLSYDAHFWIGSESTQDEYGTAAYKTVELDDYLKGDAVQHREVENHESAKFLEYFKGGAIQYLKGGVATGFKKVEAEVRPTRLLRVKGRAGNIAVTEVARKRDAMNSGDVFILDCAGSGAPRNFGAQFRRNSDAIFAHAPHHLSATSSGTARSRTPSRSRRRRSLQCRSSRSGRSPCSPRAATRATRSRRTTRSGATSPASGGCSASRWATSRCSRPKRAGRTTTSRRSSRCSTG